MIAISDKTTVGEVACALPGSTQVFEQYGIDFCCGGDNPLIEVCREKGISLQELLDKIENTQRPLGGSPQTDWASATLSQLVDHILAKHHAYLWAELPRLDAMLTKVVEVHGEKHPDSIYPLRETFTGLRQELQEHMWKEENILFPLIKTAEQSGGGGGAAGMPVGGPIQVMEMEHEAAGNALRRMRQVTSDYQVPPDGCATYSALFDGLKTLEADLHQHIHLENNFLFPRALELGG